jgi:hypothetical protein
MTVREADVALGVAFAVELDEAAAPLSGEFAFGLIAAVGPQAARAAAIATKVSDLRSAPADTIE